MRSLVAWTLVSGLGAWTVARLGGFERGYPLVPLIAYTPFVAIAGVAIAMLAAALRRRAAAAVALVLAIVLGAAVAPRALGGPSGAEGGDGPSIGVLTFNMLRGGADPDAVLALALSTDAEVVSIQEITDRGIARLREAGLEDRYPYRLDDGEDVALYSVAPLRRVPSPEGLVLPIATGTATFGGVTVELSAVHPSAPVDGPQVSALRHDLDLLPPASDAPLRILAGDFNSTLDNEGLRDLISTGYEDAAEQVGAGLRATWPARRRIPPPVTIDHVLVDERSGVRGVSVHVIPGSDHRAVFAEVVLPLSTG